MDREVDFDFIKEIWKRNRNEISLYINSPYCAAHCDYCIYWSTTKDKLYKDFYERHLPEQIDKYLPIINSSKIRNIYFGGGTTNIDGLNVLIPIFEKLKNVEARERVIELHFGMRISDEDIEILKKYKFTTAIICVQTFDEKILKLRKRVNLYKNDIDSIIGKLQEAGIFVGVDFMEFPGKHANALIEDFRVISRLKNLPNEITVDPLFQDRTKPEEMLEYYNKAFELLQNRYIGNNIDLFRVEHVECPRLLRRDTAYRALNGEVWTFTGQQEQYQLSEEPVSVLGIGTYKKPSSVKKCVWSYTNRYVYYEYYDGKEIKYFLSREKSFFDKARDIIDMIEKAAGGIDPPNSLEIFIKNTVYTQSMLSNDDERLYYEVYSNCADQSFINKLRETLPEHSPGKLYKDIQYKDSEKKYFDNYDPNNSNIGNQPTLKGDF